jgi:hypothetical protein
MLKDVTKAVKGNKTIMLVLGIVLIVVIVVIVWNIYKGFKAGSNAVGQTLGNDAIAIRTGIQAARVGHIRGIADLLWNKAVTNWIFTINYNEQMFIDNINKMSNVKEVSLLDEFFRDKAGYSIGYVIAVSFSTSERAKLKPEYLGVLN